MQYACKIAAASVVGTSHLESQIPCQDYAAGVNGQSVAAIALADGAGSSPHSQTGARIVVTDILELLQTDFHSFLALDGDDKDEELVGDIIVERILTRLRSSLALCAERDSIPFQNLASTLLFAATDGVDFLCGQLGDGRIALFNSDLSARRLRASTSIRPYL